ncbi:hypothetical protein MPSEU_000929800 [Mayamaea pseudoterrestris]|nr:hypothetical protein MPSEU_000929800 [Mayamaea pseudoterrestris]
MSSFLQAVLWIKTSETGDLDDDQNHGEMSWEPLRLAGLTLRFLGQLAALVCSSYLALKRLVKCYRPSTVVDASDTANGLEIDVQLLPRLILAWVLPTSFYLLTLFLHTWESSSAGSETNRMISSLLVTVYQALAVQAVVDVCVRDETAAASAADALTVNESKAKMRVWAGTTVAALASRALLFSVLFKEFSRAIRQ